LYRQTRVLGVLLILQVVVMVGIGIWLFSNIDWDRILTLANGQAHLEGDLPKPLERQLEQAVLYAIYFLAPAILLLLAGLGFVLLGRRGWMLASVAQAICLLVCLFSYTDPRPWFAYPIIAYCILMILYLNSQGVRAVVHSRRMAPAGARSETGHGE
jgi:MFS family permease